MDQTICFSDVTKNYLSQYQEILAEMIAGMTAAQPTKSISHTFIAQMIPHHLAAIEMSKNLLRYTTSLPLQGIAKNIIAEQTKSIADMQRADEICSDFGNAPMQINAYLTCYERIATTMFWEMERTHPSNNINVCFLREMIPHHRGAVRMSKNALSYPLCPELMPILQAIVTSQEKGIRQMQLLLARVPHSV